MRISRKQLASFVGGISWVLISAFPAVADDTELFVGLSGPDMQPNILLLIDTSLSMDDLVVTQTDYDPLTVYAGTCASGRVYFRSGAGEPPTCDSDDWVDASYMVCQAAQDAFDAGAGLYSGTIAQYDSVQTDTWDTSDQWEGLSAFSPRHTEYVECEDDAGVHGDGVSASDLWPMNGDDANLWTDDPNAAIAWGSSPTDDTYTLFEANYVNWYYGPPSMARKIDIIKDVAANLVNSVNGVNIGLMTLNDDEGGPIRFAVEDIATARTDLIDTISALTLKTFTPLSEALYEAGLYFRGASVDYGNVQGPPTSVVDSRMGASGGAYDIYKSPIASACQKNFVVLLTDGVPTEDYSADDKIVSQPNYGAVVGPVCDGSGDGKCLDDMADYLNNADLVDDSIMADQQNVVTYTIGFDVDFDLLEDTAQRGGGTYFTADDTASLSAALTSIVTSILDTSTSFSAPAVAVNNFNRTQNLNELFVAMFRPRGNVHWEGNLKKYSLDPETSEIVDANGIAAVDTATGFFKDTSQSFWTTGIDGAVVANGGAAHEIPAPAARNVYTYLGSSDLTNASNAVEISNALLNDGVLGIGSPGDPTRDEVISFARGADVGDVDNDNDTTEPRRQMGDPLHAQPVTVIYGGTLASPDITDAVVYFATNDGYLHAIDPNTGEELWAFVPPEFLQDQTQLLLDQPTVDKHYGIDGDPIVQIHANQNGVIEPGEKVYLFFGVRRGGSFYYGLDVTDPGSPSVLWRLDSATLTNVGQTWSPPVPTRVLVGDGSGQNVERGVLLFGGGYDTSQDNLVAEPDASGNSIFMVDSETGALLWEASDTGSSLDLAAMQYSIPAEIKVIDLDSDGFADRMYAADMGGQIWRFDIFNGANVGGLVTGGVIAQLGAAPNATPGAIESRRFYYAPDAALVNDDFQTYIHIGIGSGHRAHPNSTDTQDRFYALRDYLPFGTRTQAEYDALTPIVDSDLIDVTDDIDTIVPVGSAGWRFELRLGGWSGEKVLAESRTFDNRIFFTTFEPTTPTGSGCNPALGTNRLYMVDVVTGKPVTNLDESVDPEILTETDRYTEFEGSISSEVVFLFPSPADANCVGDQCTPPPVACVDLFCFPPGFANNPIRTFWSQESTY